MPPRFAYWTILIDNTPTAFRARERQELLPTLTQLKRTNPNVELKWFAQGRLWDSQEAQRASWQRPSMPTERRNKDWRPGGDHKDPRAKFDKEAQRRKRREMRAERDKLGARPPRDAAQPWQKPGAPPSSDRPWQTKPTGPRAERKPWQHKPAGGPPRDGEKPWGKPGGPARADRPWQTKPTGARAERKPWQHKAAGPPRGDRPWSGKPPRDRAWSGKPPTGQKPWAGKPRGDRPWSGTPPRDRPRKPFQPRMPPGGPPPNAGPRKRRDDEPPDRD